MTIYYLTWILRTVFGKNPLAEFKQVYQAGNGWVGVLVDKVNGQEYVCSFVPVTSQVTVTPNTVDQLLKMNEGGA